MFTLGYDLGSSYIKACIWDVKNGVAVASVTVPEKELVIHSPFSGYAKQDPADWWEQVVIATRRLFTQCTVQPKQIKAIGIAYQMHGLIGLDSEGYLLLPSIIWCDSRATQVGERIAETMGHELLLKKVLNLPGNFTFSKLLWLKENMPNVFSLIHKIMLPGDWLAFKMTGIIATTPSGLSEMALWDVENQAPATFLLDQYNINHSLLPTLVPNFGSQGTLTQTAAKELGLISGIPITYRAGDQPNNAFALGVFEPKQAAATAGTSGVVYSVTDSITPDPKSRVNPFLHINHSAAKPRYGVLLCVNGTGAFYSWLRKLLFIDAANTPYSTLNTLADGAPLGAMGVMAYPFGNGAERILENKNVGAMLRNIDFNRHNNSHIVRAGLEGIVFALHYGMDIMADMAVKPTVVRAGAGNLFESTVFAETFATLTGSTVEIYQTTGAEGAARGAALGLGLYISLEESAECLRPKAQFSPNPHNRLKLQAIYNSWKNGLHSL
jgi:xylulokinase